MNTPADQKSFSADRRKFLTGATFATAVLIVPLFSEAEGATSMQGLYPSGGTLLVPAVKIDRNNLVTIIIGSTEMGQGVMTGLAQLVAAELMLDWTQVRGEHSVATSANLASYGNPAFGNAQLTGGSWSIRGYYKPLRQAAAKARAMLIQAAAMIYQQQGGTSTNAWWLATGGYVTNGASTYKFSDLVATAATLPVPSADQVLQDANSIIGTGEAL